MTIEARLMTADELAQLPDDGMRHELVSGELRTMPPTGLDHAEHEIEIGASLKVHVKVRRLGRVYVGDPGFILRADPDTVRAPDVAFIRLDRLPDGRSPTGYYYGAPDLAVEVISPNDRYTQVEEKVAEWLEHGARLVFVVNPRRKSVAVHRPGEPIRVLGVGDVLDGEDVVPGWSMPLSDLFDQE